MLDRFLWCFQHRLLIFQSNVFQVITPEMKKFILEEIHPKCAVGLVGGSDEKKISEQMGGPEGRVDKIQ